MDNRILNTLLRDVKTGKVSVSAALDALKHLPFEEMDFAKVDHHRSLRSVVPEVIFAQNKKTDAIAAIANAMLKRSGRFLITRAREDIYAALNVKGSKFYPASGIIACGKSVPKKGHVLVISAGTSDIPVAEEAEVTASFLGSRTEKIIDVGVAGIHRLLSFRDRIAQARVVIVIAGMEGALPSVVGGLIDKPVIAVPTSIGYGANFGGISALLAMLNSCSSNVTVVNIDNGFGAGYVASIINKMSVKSQ